MPDAADLRAVAFVSAAGNGDLGTVQRELSAGIDVNVQNSRGSTALQWAAHCGQEGVVAELLRHQPDLAIRAKDGWRALTSAAANSFEPPSGGRTQVLKMLLAHGDAPSPGDEDWKALHYAAEWGNIDSVRLLIEHGMDPDVRDAHGLTPLMRAARKGKVEVIRLLLDAGASTRKRNNAGQTAAAIAKAAKRRSALEALGVGLSRA